MTSGPVPRGGLHERPAAPESAPPVDEAPVATPPPEPRGAPRQPQSSITRRLEALPLRVRLVAVVLVLLFVALALTGAATTVLMRRFLLDAVDSDLKAAADPTTAQALATIVGNQPSGLPTNYAVRIMPTDGSSVIRGPRSTGERTQQPDIPRLSLDQVRALKGEAFTVGSVDGPGQWRVVAGALRGGAATVAVAVPLGNLEDTVRRLGRLVTLIGLAVILACAVIGWFAVRRAFRPLSQIEDTAAAIAAGDLTRRIPEHAAQDEVTSLSRSLNSMLGQIEQSFAAREASEERMRQFVADASHELRTPLAAVRGYAELFRQGAVREPDDIATAFRRIEDESVRMGGLVEDLLLLARLDDQRPMSFTPVDLTVLAADAVQDARALDSTRRVNVVGLGAGLSPILVEGDEPRLRQVVTNLVGNAVNHTPEGTPIEIAVGRREAGRAVLEIRDHGPGVDPERARKVFERFYRADPSRVRGAGGGNGLGLAIVAAIVAAHRGKVGVAPTPGGGATFVVDLPTGNSQPPSSVV